VASLLGETAQHQVRVILIDLIDRRTEIDAGSLRWRMRPSTAKRANTSPLRKIPKTN
jgi:hypothetical protein